jgi:hypothetical protein
VLSEDFFGQPDGVFDARAKSAFICYYNFHILLIVIVGLFFVFQTTIILHRVQDLC